MLLVTLVGCHNGGIILFPDGAKYLRFVEQETQLLHESVVTLLGRCTEPLVLVQAQCLHESIHTTSKLRDTLALSLKFLVFRAGNGDHFSVACLEIASLINAFIIPYM